MTTTAPERKHTTQGDAPLLSVRDLTVTFQRQGEEPFRAVDGVSFDVRPGQTVGLVGESGCGKSVTSLAIMGLLPHRGNTITGTVDFEGTNLLSLSDKQLGERRGRGRGGVVQNGRDSIVQPATSAPRGSAHHRPRWR